jgi:hypothetical protein
MAALLASLLSLLTELAVGGGVLRVAVTSEVTLVTSTVAPTLEETADTKESEVITDFTPTENDAADS